MLAQVPHEGCATRPIRRRIRADLSLVLDVARRELEMRRTEFGEPCQACVVELVELVELGTV
jgi:hypothetical protein